MMFGDLHTVWSSVNSCAYNKTLYCLKATMCVLYAIGIMLQCDGNMELYIVA